MITIRKLIHDIFMHESINRKKSFSEIIQNSSIYFEFYTNNSVKFCINLNARDDNLNKNNVFRKINIKIMDGICKISEEMHRYARDPYSIFSSTYDGVPENIINSMLVLNGEIDLNRNITQFIHIEES